MACRSRFQHQVLDAAEVQGHCGVEQKDQSDAGFIEQKEVFHGKNVPAIRCLDWGSGGEQILILRMRKTTQGCLWFWRLDAGVYAIQAEV